MFLYGLLLLTLLYHLSIFNGHECMRSRRTLSEQWKDSRPHCGNCFFLSATCTAAPTACNISCTFDVDFCGWEQAVDDNFDWIRNKGPTPSPNTGPSYDHTTGGRNRKQYLAVLQVEQSLRRLQRASFNRKSRQRVSRALSRIFCSSQEFVLGWMTSAAHGRVCNMLA